MGGLCAAVVGWHCALVPALLVLEWICIEVVGNLRPDIEPAQLSPCKIGVISCSVLVIKGEIPRLPTCLLVKLE